VNRFSIRTKQLLFFSAALILILLINLFSLYRAYRYTDSFGEDLKSFFGIERFRRTLEENTVALERYVREHQEEDLTAFKESRAELWRLFRLMEQDSNTSMRAYFQLNATFYGLTAYLDYAGSAIGVRDSGRDDYYLFYHKADHIAAYVKGYVQELMHVRLDEGLVAYNRVAEQAATVRAISFIGTAVVGVVVLLFVVVFSNRITTPIRTLARASIRIAHGDLDVDEVEVNSSDEIGILAGSFNDMSRNIKNLVNDLRDKSQVERKLHAQEIKNVRMAQSLREAQLLGLQAQINPHFLFNALNTISRTALFERAESTSKLIQSLSNLFRYNLRNSNKTVTLKQELEVVEEYIHIQKHRFQERLIYAAEWQLDPESVVIPSFVLQPLVENAVKYGIEPLEEGGQVTVRAWKEGKLACIEVRDTGIGMGRQRLEEVLSHRNEVFHGKTGGIGIGNVMTRLALHYHGKETFEIESEEGHGTCVRMRIPVRKEQKRHVSAAHS